MAMILNKRNILVWGLVVVVFVVGLIYLVQNSIPTPTVSNSSPVNQSDNILVNTKVDVFFDKLDKRAIPDITVQTTPNFSFDLAWLPNQVRIIPKENLKTNTKYTVGVAYNKKQINKFSFTTIPYSQHQIDTEGNLQTKGDLEFGNTYKDFINQYPWYLSLPIETGDYRIVYDFQTNSFRIRILTVGGNNKQAQITQEALSSLKEIGVKNPNNYYVLQFSTPSASTVTGP